MTSICISHHLDVKFCFFLHEADLGFFPVCPWRLGKPHPNQNIRIHRCCHGEPQAHGHPRGIILKGHVDEFPNLGKVNYLINLGVDLVRCSPDPRSPAGQPSAPILRVARRSGSLFVSPNTEPMIANVASVACGVFKIVASM